MKTYAAVAIIAGSIGIGIGIGQNAPTRPEPAQVAQGVEITPEVAPRAAQAPDRRLYDAIRYVESGGQNIEIGAVGAAGERGPYQITFEYWLDGTENTAWATREAFNRLATDPFACEYVMSRVWWRYGAQTDEQKARLHHRGPNRERQDDEYGNEYWLKVSKAMEAER